MSESLTLADLRVANIARNVEWDSGDEKLSATFRATELAGEIGEICNVVKKLERERIGIRGSRDTLAHLAEELADGLISLDLVAMRYDIALGPATIAKFNATSAKNGLRTIITSTPTNAEATREEARKEAIDQIDVIAALREWFGGDRYSRDYEYLDAQYSNQMRKMLEAVFADRLERASTKGRDHG